MDRQIRSYPASTPKPSVSGPPRSGPLLDIPGARGGCCFARGRRVSHLESGRMRAAVYREKRRLVVEERPVPEPGPHEVVLHVSHCGVCGSDLHIVMEGWGRPDSIGGHEYSGRIAALGSDVMGWELGAPVVGGPAAGCGSCEYCTTHRPSLCASHGTPGVAEFQGAFAEYVRVHESQLRRDSGRLVAARGRARRAARGGAPRGHPLPDRSGPACARHRARAPSGCSRWRRCAPMEST